MTIGMACFQVGDNILFAPVAYTAGFAGGDVGGVPSIKRRASQISVLLFTEHEVTRRMAGAAMFQRIGKILAAA